MLIDAIIQSSGLTVATDGQRGRRQRRRPAYRGAITQVVAREGVSVADALSIGSFALDLTETDVADTHLAVPVSVIARRLSATAAAALAIQARLGAAAVIQLVDPRG